MSPPSWYARALLAVLVMMAILAESHSRADSAGDSGARPAMLILLPDASKAAEAFSKFLKQRAAESHEWTVAIRQMYHLTLSDSVSTAIKKIATTNTTGCTRKGRSVVFLLSVSAGELDALREKARMDGDAEAKMRNRKKRKKKGVDLLDPCVVWLEEAADLELVSGLDISNFSAALTLLPPYRNTIRQEEEEEEDNNDEVGAKGKAIPKSWKLKKPPKAKPALGSYLIFEAGMLAFAAGNFTSAVSFFETAAELQRDSAAPLNKLGMALMAAGNKARAVDVYQVHAAQHLNPKP